MDILNSLIQSLRLEERTEFRSYLQRNSKSKKELQLLDLVYAVPVIESSEILGRLYKPVNLNAYHSLRKRLISQILGFLMLKQMKADDQSVGGVLGMISMGQTMIDRNAPKVAAHFLLKAENTAVRKKHFDALENIYNVLIKNLEVLGLEPEEIVQRWEANTQRYETFRKLKMAHAVIRKQISNAKMKGEPLDPETIIDPVIKSINLTVEEANNPEFLHTIVIMARSAFASSKDYSRLEPFLMRIYKRLKNNNAFGKNELIYEISFTYMIAHTLYRNRKFKEAEKWLNELNKHFKDKQAKTDIYYAKSLTLEAAIAFYTGKNKKSIEIMEKSLSDKSQIFDVHERMNMQLNLAVYYFNDEEFRKANKMLVNIGHTDRWIDENLGKEWRFKKNMIEMIVQYDLGNVELAGTMLKRMKRYFNSFLTHPSYKNAAVFMKFISKMIEDPQSVQTPAFQEMVMQTIAKFGDMRGDIQAITFFCWLRSKMSTRPYYKVLLEHMKQN